MHTALKLIRELLFADNAALTSHTEENLQVLINQSAHAFKEFGLAIIIKQKNTYVMGQVVPEPPSFRIDNEVLEVTNYFTYLDSIITNNLSLDREIDSHFWKATEVLAKLTKRIEGETSTS